MSLPVFLKYFAPDYVMSRDKLMLIALAFVRPMMSHLCEFLRDGPLPATEAYVNLRGATQQEAMRTFKAVMDNPGYIAWADLVLIVRFFRSDIEDTMYYWFVY